MEKLLGAKKTPKQKLKYFCKHVKKDKWLLLLLLPAFAFLIVFCYVPMYGVIIAFKEYNAFKGIMGSPWASPFYKHFLSFVSDSSFWLILRNTFIIALTSVILDAPLPVIFALMINEVTDKKTQKIIQTVSYAPYFVSVVVVVGICQNFTGLDHGVVNVILRKFGLEGTVSYMSNPSWFLPIYLISGLWQGLGWWAIIYVGTLANVDASLVEAAKIDGANRFKRVIHVNLPAILPMATLSLILSVGSLMSVGFEKIYLMQSDLNQSVTEVIPTYVYKRTFGTKGIKPYSFGTAVGLFNSAINIALLFIANFISKHAGGETVI